MVDCPRDLVFPDPNISVHDGVEEENLPEHDEDDDASQTEDSQPHNRAVNNYNRQGRQRHRSKRK